MGSVHGSGAWVRSMGTAVWYVSTVHFNGGTTTATTAMAATTLQDIVVHLDSIHYTALHSNTLHSTTLQSTQLQNSKPCYTTLRYTQLITTHYATLHSVIPQLQIYNSITQQLQLRLRYTALHPATMGEVTDQVATATNVTTPKEIYNSNHLSVDYHGLPLPSVTKLSCRSPIYSETSATASCGTTGTCSG